MAWLTTLNAANRKGVSKNCYRQVVSDQWIPTHYVDGVPGGFRREVVRFTTVETVEEWVGVNEASAIDAVNTEDLSELDALGRGTFIQWNARRANEANGWTVTKTTKVITQEISDH